MPMGPIELADTIGLDVMLHVAQILGEAYDVPVPEELAQRVERGELGRKGGQGFYRWEDGRAVKPDAGVGEPPQDLRDRIILPMLNEAVACLREQVVEDADMLDAGVIFGTGFAPFRGGPMQYIRDVGADEIRARLEVLSKSYGDRFAPDPGWESLEDHG